MLHIELDDNNVVTQIITNSFDDIAISANERLNSNQALFQACHLTNEALAHTFNNIVLLRNERQAYYLHLSIEPACRRLIIVDVSMQCQKYFDLDSLDDSASLCATWAWDMRNNSIYWSDELFEMFGESTHFSPKYEDFLRYVPKHEYPKIESAITGALTHNATYEISHSIIQKSTQKILVQAFGVIVKDAAKKNIFLLGTTFDCSKLF